MIDQGTAQERASPADAAAGDPEAIDFVRFCYKRRHVGWPELYDEMCAVAGRGLYHGFCADDLNRIGIGFALYEMPALATMVQRVVAEDQERRRLSVQAVRLRISRQRLCRSRFRRPRPEANREPRRPINPTLAQGWSPCRPPPRNTL